jgi:F0F1-type ATP synthase membrane subunit c/vacuolar-type H+-ATPase subunit K
LLFVKAAKVVSLSFMFAPLTGCAIATGILFAALIRGVSYSPDHEDSLFNYAIIGFAFIESFAFIVLLMAMVLLTL